MVAGENCSDAGEVAQAKRYLAKVCELAKEYILQWPDFQFTCALAYEAHRKLESLYDKSEELQNNLALAEENLRTAKVLFQPYKGWRMQIASGYLRLSQAQENAGELAKAIESMQAAIETWEQELREPEPVFPSTFYADIIGARAKRLSELQLQSGDIGQALETTNKWIQFANDAIKSAGDDDSYIEFASNKLDDLYLQQVRCHEANHDQVDIVATYLAALKARAEEHSRFEKQWHSSLNTLVERYVQACDSSDSLPEGLRELASMATDWNDFVQFDIQLTLGKKWRDVGEREQSELAFCEAQVALQRLSNDAHLQSNALVIALDQLPFLLTSNHIASATEAALRDDIEETVQTGNWLAVIHDDLDSGTGRDGIDTWDCWNQLALAYYRKRNWQGAEKEAELAVEIARQDPGKLLRIAPLFVLAQKYDEFHALCEQLISKRNRFNVSQLTNVIRLCSMDRLPFENVHGLREDVQRVRDDGPDWAGGAISIVLARLGDTDDALSFHSSGNIESNNEDSEPAVKHPPLTLFIHATVQMLCGERDRAQYAFEQGKQRYAEVYEQYAANRIETEVRMHELQQFFEPSLTTADNLQTTAL